MKRATPRDLYDTLSYKVWKSGLEMIKELENNELKVSGWLKGNKYVHLAEWEDERLVRSWERELSEERLRIRGGNPLREYLRISTGTPEKLQEKVSGLEESLSKA